MSFSLGIPRLERFMEPFRVRTIHAAGRPVGEYSMRSIFLWLIGIPIPIILLLAFCTHHF